MSRSVDVETTLSVLEQWERLLAPDNGQLSQDEPQLGQLIERVRRLGHLHEGGLQHHPHQGAT